MREKLRARLAAGGPKNEKRSVNLLLALGLGGMLLILLSDLFSGSGGGRAKQADAAAAAQQPVMTEAEYTAALEQRLQQMISQVEGAGETVVMITLDCSRESVYALNEKQSSGEGGVYEASHVLLDGASGEQPLVEMTWEPEIRGVAVVCQGGANVTVAARITELVSVVLGVPSHRISIAKMS